MLPAVSRLRINSEAVTGWASAQHCLISMQELWQNVKRKKKNHLAIKVFFFIICLALLSCCTAAHCIGERAVAMNVRYVS